MNWRGIMLLMWILGAVGWAAYSLLTFAKGCVYAPDSWLPCTGSSPLTARLGARAYDLSDWLWLIAGIAGPPLGILILGLASIWVLRGFERPTKSN